MGQHHEWEAQLAAADAPPARRFACTLCHRLEAGILCSAATGMNVSEVFWFARKSIVYPTAPLYDIRTRKFTPDCLRALKRIFRMCQTEVRQPLRLLCCFVSVFPSAAVPRAGCSTIACPAQSDCVPHGERGSPQSIQQSEV